MGDISKASELRAEWWRALDGCTYDEIAAEVRVMRECVSALERGLLIAPTTTYAVVDPSGVLRSEPRSGTAIAEVDTHLDRVKRPDKCTGCGLAPIIDRTWTMGDAWGVVCRGCGRYTYSRDASTAFADWNAGRWNTITPPPSAPEGSP